jgi:hypothetical protein
MASEALVKALMVTTELLGTELSADAARVMVNDLERYPEHQVMGALARCRRELKGRLTVAEVISRLEDGRPGAEEAWAMIPKSEADSVVWSDEMAHAWSIAAPLIEDDPIAARMAFKESYTGIVARARDAGTAPQWTPSLGTDKSGRAHAIRTAADRRHITAARALDLLALVGPEHVEQHRAALSGPRPIGALLPVINTEDCA